MIGVLIEWYGQGAAEGFYHLFEGWVLFMTSLGLLILEMWLLASIGRLGNRSPFLSRFTWADQSAATIPEVTLQSPNCDRRFQNPAYLCSVAILVPVAFASMLMVEREEIPPPRAIFIDFPMRLNGWLGTSLSLERQYIDALRFDDYVLADFRFGDGQPVNLYAAYYQSQRKGQSAHSPHSCLPGGGWEISSFRRMDLPANSEMVRPLHVNRALIQKDSQKQIVMYWFKQRDRILSNEYLVKLYLFWDAVSRGRTDGALVRIASPVGPGETEDIVDQRLLRFVSVVAPELNRYVPD
jgi:EpsI family protein